MNVTGSRMIVRIAAIVERCNVAILIDFGIALKLLAREVGRLGGDRLGRRLARWIKALARDLYLVYVVLGGVFDNYALERFGRALERVTNNGTFCNKRRNGNHYKASFIYTITHTHTLFVLLEDIFTALTIFNSCV